MALERAFETEEILLNDLVGVVSGAADPTTGGGFDAPVGSMYLRTDGKTYKKTGGGVNDWAEAAGGGDEPHMEESVPEPTHGFVIGDVLRYDAGAWVKAQADVVGNTEALGVVSAVADANNFTITYSGRINGLSGLTPDCVYFLSASVAGGLTLTEPAISKPILYATSATSAVIQIRRGNAAAVASTAVEVQDEGVQITPDVLVMNFKGNSVLVTEPVADEADITIAPVKYDSHTYAISGEIKVPVGDTDFINPFFIGVAPGNVAELAKVIYEINSGTSVTFDVEINDAGATGFTGLSATTTKTVTDAADVAVADEDKIAIVVTGVAGSPFNLSVTLIFEVVQ